MSAITGPPARDAPTILIVDDTPANIGVLASYLESHGFAVMVAQDGEEGIERARFAQPDLILLDVMMPAMDGFEACRRLKASAATWDIPVIFMTALAETGDKVTGFEVGGVDYVTKPFQVEEVLARVNTHLALLAARRQLTAQNRQLQQEIAVREQAEAALQRARDGLEVRVAQRTAELAEANTRLRAENLERSRVEAALRESEAKIRRLVESNIIGVFFWDLGGGVSEANDAFLRIVGYSRQDQRAGELRWMEITAPECHAAVERALEQLKRDGICTPYEKELIRKDGSRVPVLVGLALFAGSQEQGVGFVLDLSERKQAEAERHARLAAEAANRAKSEFLANMSHELRSPLNTILGFTRLITRQPDLPEATREDLELVLKSGEHLHALINDVLDLSKLEAGRTTLNEADFDLDFLLDDLKDMLTPGAVDKSLQLIFAPRLGVPHYVHGDPLKLRQVLINLIGNAIKFTQCGNVTVQVEARPGGQGNGRDDSECRLAFAVADTGPGIAGDELKNLFGAFMQARAGREAQEGTGLGLAISRGFVELMGGEIRVDSEVGRGTTVRFELPVRVLVGATALEAPPSRILGLAPGQPGYRLLVVDDQSAARHLLVRLLAPLGFELREACNGQEAIEVWRKWRPDLIWMDLRMPVLDGREAARRIRAAGPPQQPVIIALTASSFEEERADVLAAGCDDFLRKPFREADLFTLMEKHLGVRFVYPEEAPAAAPLPDPAALAALSVEVRAEFEQALIQLDPPGVARSIETIRGFDAELADALACLAQDFAYNRILALIQAEAPDAEGC